MTMFVVLRGAQKCLAQKHCCLLQCIRCGSHYDTLGLGKNASQEEIRTAFLNLSKQLHPDTNTNDPSNHDKFVQLNEAYTVLSKHITRRDYDLELELGFKPVSRAHPGGSDKPPNYSHTSGAYYYSPDAEQRENFRDDLSWQRDRNKKRFRIPWQAHGFGLVFIVVMGGVFGHSNDVISRAEKEREYWQQYAASNSSRHEPTSRDRMFRSRAAALVLCAVLYGIGSLMGLYIYHRSKKNTEEVRKQSVMYAMEVRERRRSGKYVGDFDEKFEKMFEKELDAKEKKRASGS